MGGGGGGGGGGVAVVGWGGGGWVVVVGVVVSVLVVSAVAAGQLVVMDLSLSLCVAIVVAVVIVIISVVIMATLLGVVVVGVMLVVRVVVRVVVRAVVKAIVWERLWSGYMHAISQVQGWRPGTSSCMAKTPCCRAKSGLPSCSAGTLARTSAGTCLGLWPSATMKCAAFVVYVFGRGGRLGREQSARARPHRKAYVYRYMGP